MKKIFGDKIWEKIFSSREWGKYPPEEVIRFYSKVKNMLNKNKIEVLDIGCGIGACTWFMAKEGGNVTAVDGSPSAIKRVQEILKEFNIAEDKVTLILGDITLPKSFVPIHKKFDIILDNYSLYANPYDKIINAYKDYYDYLSNNGFFLTNNFGLKTTGYGTGEKFSNNTYRNVEKGPLKMRGLVTFWEREKLTHLLESFGYNIFYTELILEEREGALIEKLVTCLCKKIIKR